MLTTDAFSLDLTLDDVTGQLLTVADPDLGMALLRYAPGDELALNGQPLALCLRSVEAKPTGHVTEFDATVASAYGSGAALRVRRVLTRGGMGMNSSRAGSLHLRYEVERAPHTAPGEELDYIWQPALEAPLHVETLGALCAPALWFGDETRMRAIAIGGSGPREHVSLEDGPVAEVAPYLQRQFRTAFPGQSMVAGALYYHPDDERFVWVIARRPTTGGHVVYGPQQHAYHFYYFTPLGVHDRLTTPAISLFWGQGLEHADRVLAEQFDCYEEPPSWWYHTSWFWLHSGMQPGGNFPAMAQAADILMDEGGVNGFGMLVHDIPWSGRDIDVMSPMPSPGMGGDAALRRAAARIREKGGHTYAWFTRHGHRPDSPAWQDGWGIQGIDGRSVRLRNGADSGVFLDICNPGDPSYQEYLRRWIEYYVTQLGITGLFWDSGLQPLPPDFGNKPYQRWPGQTAALATELYQQLYRFGRSLSDDFFMWVEGINVDVPMNAFAVDNPTHGPASGHALMHRLAHAGPKRLVWRSAWRHDVASGFPFISPASDIGWQPDSPRYRDVAADPMNRWLTRTVRERGVRQAVGIADGVSVLDEFVVLCPGITGPVTVPAHLCRGEALVHEITGATIPGLPVPGGLRFDVRESGAYRMG